MQPSTDRSILRTKTALDYLPTSQVLDTHTIGFSREIGYLYAALFRSPSPVPKTAKFSANCRKTVICICSNRFFLTIRNTVTFAKLFAKPSHKWTRHVPPRRFKKKTNQIEFDSIQIGFLRHSHATAASCR